MRHFITYINAAARVLLIVAMVMAAYSSQTNACPYRYEMKDAKASCCAMKNPRETKKKSCCAADELSRSCCCAVIPFLSSSPVIEPGSSFVPLPSAGQERPICFYTTPSVPPPRSV